MASLEEIDGSLEMKGIDLRTFDLPQDFSDHFKSFFDLFVP